MKTVYGLLFLALQIFTSNSFANVDSGLIAHWSFDDCNAVDVTNNKNDGLIKGDPKCVQGKMGKAFSFNGTTDYIYVNDSPSLSNLSDLTLSAWVYIESSSQDDANGIITKWYQYNPNSTSTDNKVAQDTYAIWIQKGRAVGATNNHVLFQDAIKNNAVAPIKEWFHIVFSHSKSQGEKLYVNGTLQAKNDYVGSVVPSNNPIIIGADNNYGKFWRYFNGAIDDARIYNRALTDMEVIELYNKEQPLSGSVLGMKSFTVSCTNMTTGKKVTFKSLNGLSSWDCNKQGLEVGKNQKVKIQLSGSTYQ